MNWMTCSECGGVKRDNPDYNYCNLCGGNGMSSLLSETQKSCIFTAKASGKKLPDVAHTMPDEATRLLCARLIFEEARETIGALGFLIAPVKDYNPFDNPEFEIVNDGVYPLKPNEVAPTMVQIIDGCCDTIYVATYCLTLMGVPDVPHMEEVCKANDAKFPNGVATPHPTVPGKYGKPVGWVPPDHKKFMSKPAAGMPWNAGGNSEGI